MPLSYVPIVTSPASLSVAGALRVLEEGNDRFVNGDSVRHDVRQAIQITAARQAPFVAVLSCIDSRVPVEAVFDLSLGHAFSARVAGNVLSDDILGSLEFSCALAGAKLLVVLGHTGCGAVKGACDGVELGNLTGLLEKIRPAVEATPTGGERSSSNDAWVDAVARENVERTKASLLERSPVLRDLVASGAVGLVGAMYDVRTGRVEFLDAL